MGSKLVAGRIKSCFIQPKSLEVVVPVVSKRRQEVNLVLAVRSSHSELDGIAVHAASVGLERRIAEADVRHVPGHHAVIEVMLEKLGLACKHDALLVCLEGADYLKVALLLRRRNQDLHAAILGHDIALLWPALRKGLTHFGKDIVASAGLVEVLPMKHADYARVVPAFTSQLKYWHTIGINTGQTRAHTQALLAPPAHTQKNSRLKRYKFLHFGPQISPLLDT
jgi:hypothetical protein